MSLTKEQIQEAELFVQHIADTVKNGGDNENNIIFQTLRQSLKQSELIIWRDDAEENMRHNSADFIAEQSKEK